MIPPLQTGLRVIRDAGAIDYEFHRWLQYVQRRLDGPVVGDQANAGVTVDDGQFGIHGKRLTVPAGGRARILGSGRLVICG